MFGSQRDNNSESETGKKRAGEISEREILCKELHENVLK